MQVSIWDCFPKQLYRFLVVNIMVTQLLRVSCIIFLGATLFTVSIKIFSPVAPLEGRREPAACDKKEYGLMGEKRDAAFHLMAVELFF